MLVVGAGPTGLMLANQLARRGVRVTIIDRHAGPARETRALGVQARTLEIYSKLDIVGRALELGKIGTGANLWADGRWMARVPLSDAGEGMTPYPYILVLGQDDNERIMGERLRDFGVSVRWNTELVGFEQQTDHVVTALRLPGGGTERLTTAWVAGCDGAHSFVRERCGITFPGAPYEHVFFVADTEATGTMVADQVNVYLWRDGFHLFFPMRGKNHWRVVGIVPGELRNRHDVGFDDVVPALRKEAGDVLAFRNCSWFSTYRIHHRCASRFRDRRCFLLGDAAHIHSPVGAQGMNTGLQDAYNLAWKLALVVGERADPALLESYERERLPVAQRLLYTTDRAFRLVVSDSWLAGLFRTRLLARLAAFALSRTHVQRLAFRTVSQIGIHYRSGPLAESTEKLPDDAPHGGDRFPWLRVTLAAGGPVIDLFDALDDLHFQLLAIGQPAPVDWPQQAQIDRVRVHAIPADSTNDQELRRARIPVPSFYLLRPDGHVGLCGIHWDAGAADRYVAGCLQLRSEGSRAARGGGGTHCNEPGATRP